MDETRKEQDPFERRLSEELEARYPSAPFDAEAVERGIERVIEARGRRSRPSHPRASNPSWWQVGPARTLLPAAASVLLFIGGSEYGRRTAAPAAPMPSAQTEDVARPQVAGVEADGSPISIQSAGSRYVANLARFAAAGDDVSAEQREIAREVALSVIYSAALELLQESTDDDLLRSIVELVQERRTQFDGGTSPPVSF